MNNKVMELTVKVFLEGLKYPCDEYANDYMKKLQEGVMEVLDELGGSYKIDNPQLSKVTFVVGGKR